MAFNQHTTGEKVVKVCIARSENNTSKAPLAELQRSPWHTVNPRLSSSPIGARKKGKDMIKEIRNIDRNIDVVFVALDLGDQESVKKCAKEILDSGKAEKIHVLINCASIMCTMHYQQTK
ncbi:hypothetical protein B0J14DRAFT_650060 [Halenospora varia]|nr:hypothetical protein B0J14DRAFT_650060 [Halenospora varia]